MLMQLRLYVLQTAVYKIRLFFPSNSTQPADTPSVFFMAIALTVTACLCYKGRDTCRMLGLPTRDASHPLRHKRLQMPSSATAKDAQQQPGEGEQELEA